MKKNNWRANKRKISPLLQTHRMHPVSCIMDEQLCRTNVPSIHSIIHQKKDVYLWPLPTGGDGTLKSSSQDRKPSMLPKNCWVFLLVWAYSQRREKEEADQGRIAELRSLGCRTRRKEMIQGHLESCFGHVWNSHRKSAGFKEAIENACSHIVQIISFKSEIYWQM